MFDLGMKIDTSLRGRAEGAMLDRIDGGYWRVAPWQFASYGDH